MIAKILAAILLLIMLAMVVALVGFIFIMVHVLAEDRNRNDEI